MMKSIFFGALAIAVIFLSVNQEAQGTTTDKTQGTSTGKPEDEKNQTTWDYVADNCLKELHKQIQLEFEASIVYLNYAAHFARDKINLPGFEKFFFNAAGEEREHGIKLIEYALMRGQVPVGTTFKLNYPEAVKDDTNGETALEAALRKEEEVTKSIRGLIEVCEKDKGYNDYHLVDYLTGEYLEEQHKGQRELAEKIKTLHKMKKSGDKLGEFLFDKNHL